MLEFGTAALTCSNVATGFKHSFRQSFEISLKLILLFVWVVGAFQKCHVGQICQADARKGEQHRIRLQFDDADTAPWWQPMRHEEGGWNGCPASFLLEIF